jgi:Restriction endonuclease/Type III restriction enzyme, res subunit
MPPKPPVLTSWQQGFVDQFVSQQHSKSLLVAASGTGKTLAVLVAAKNLFERRTVDSLLVISDRALIRDQWRHAAAQYGIHLGHSLKGSPEPHGTSATIQSLRSKDALATMEAAIGGRRWLIVADEPGNEANSVVDRILSNNKESRALCVAPYVPSGQSFEAAFRFRSELLLGRAILECAGTELCVARFAPSFALLRRLISEATSLDRMSWREFEKLIATLLENDGYTVELMQGSKDGGVDVVAMKDLGANGFYKALWQAKKRSAANKVGISVVRELADTRQEFGASKGIVVTTSYLTRGALQRIEREKYILGKVDRLDLDAWIRRTLLMKEGSILS